MSNPDEECRLPEDPTTWFVVGYCDSDNFGKKDAQIHGPYFMVDEAEKQAAFMCREFYDRKFFDRVVLVWSCLSKKLYKHEVMNWEDTNVTEVYARSVDGELQKDPDYACV